VIEERQESDTPGYLALQELGHERVHAQVGWHAAEGSLIDWSWTDGDGSMPKRDEDGHDLEGRRKAGSSGA